MFFQLGLEILQLRKVFLKRVFFKKIIDLQSAQRVLAITDLHTKDYVSFVDSRKKIVFLITTKEWMHKLCNPCVFFFCKKNGLNEPSWNELKNIVQLNLTFTRVFFFLKKVQILNKFLPVRLITLITILDSLFSLWSFTA